MPSYSSSGNVLAQASDPGAIGAGSYWADTDTENTFRRNDANTNWTQLSDANSSFALDTEIALNTPVTGTTSLALGNTDRWYVHFQMPGTASDLYLLTGIEWRNGGTINGNMVCGVEEYDANPPVENKAPIGGYGVEIAQSGANVLQRNSFVSKFFLNGAGFYSAFIQSSSATATILRTIGSSIVTFKTITYAANPALSNTTAWGAASTVLFDITVYGRKIIFSV